MDRLDSTAIVASATLLLAAATVWLAFEARWARQETARHNREVAFRAALVELAANVQLLEKWKPWLQAPS